MANRLDLQTKFEEILGSRNVYFDPPESVRMQYDAIRYAHHKMDSLHANNSVYKLDNCYEVVAIYRDPDSDLRNKIAALPMCRHDRHYVADNLHHDIFILYY